MTEERVGRSMARLAIVCWLALVACKPAADATSKKAAGTPGIPATVITIRTVTQPSNRTAVHDVVVAGNKVRTSEDLDTWRLIDLAARNVTFVDSIAKSYETLPLQQPAQAPAAAASGGVATFAVTDNRRVVHGVVAVQSLITLGAYRRELWVAAHPLIPAQLFAAMQSSSASERRDPITRDLERALATVSGFPMIDHAELPFGQKKMVVDRSVVKIERRNVPAGWFTIPAAYEDTTPKAPDASRQPASSRPPGRNTREAESRSSSTARTSP